MAFDNRNALTEAPTPAALGYRMPAEWAPHAATWLSWPYNPETWPGEGHLERAERVLAQAVGALRSGEDVRINVLDGEHEAHVRRLLAGQEGAAYPVHFHRIPTNDAWCRDHGAIFVVREEESGRLAATDWGYNAWGGKYPPFDLDNEVPRQMADLLDVRRFEGGMVLEGGSVEVNGAGLLLTTEACLLNPNRNPGWTQPQIEARLREMLGVQEILWLEGELEGDDTDGHIDNLARFVAEDTVVAIAEDDPADVNHAPLQDNLGRLEAMTTTDGRPLRVVALPMPAPVYVGDNRLPASYANFYIGNRVVLLPTYGDVNDHVAQDRLQALFPERRIVGLDCTDVAVGLGAFHCLTQQVPLA